MGNVPSEEEGPPPQAPYPQDKHDEMVIRDKQRQNEEKWRRLGDIDRQHEADMEKARTRNKEELQNAMKHSLEMAKQQVEEQQKFQDQMAKDREKWTRRADKRESKVRAQIKADGKTVQEEQKKEYEHEYEKMERGKEQLKEAREKLNAVSDEGASERAEMEKVHNEKTDKQRDEHNQFILAEVDKINEYTLEKTREIKMLKSSGEAEQIALTQQVLMLKSEALFGGHKLVEALESEGHHDEFRIDCSVLKRRFKDLKNAYDTQESLLNRALKDMKKKRPVENPPQLEIIIDAYSPFIRTVNGVFIPQKFRADYSEPFAKVKEKALKFNDLCEEIESLIIDYHKALKKVSIYNEEVLRIQEDTEKDFQKLQTVFAVLTEAVRKFEIAASNDLCMELNRQVESLNTFTQKQITGGLFDIKQLES